ncbi:hypothetical protein NDU88_002326 [Pleurodeles waltl]|uniref:Uncharacterized protein n=1 Tax=Pleurodeles waltl TaxID=8319 RepID=A0AAV7Q5N4_PLEWA|nr:hypothetical protein NDU88_002326 [Pleurodeles waltl]
MRPACLKVPADVSVLPVTTSLPRRVSCSTEYLRGRSVISVCLGWLTARAPLSFLSVTFYPGASSRGRKRLISHYTSPITKLPAPDAEESSEREVSGLGRADTASVCSCGASARTKANLRI